MATSSKGSSSSKSSTAKASTPTRNGQGAPSAAYISMMYGTPTAKGGSASAGAGSVASIKTPSSPGSVKKTTQLATLGGVKYGAGSTASMGKSPTPLPVHDYSKDISLNPGMSVDPNAPNMSTLGGPKKGTITQGGVFQSTIPANVPAASKNKGTIQNKTDVPPAKTFTDFNGNTYGTQAEADAADRATKGGLIAPPTAETNVDGTPVKRDVVGEIRAKEEAALVEEKNRQEAYLKSQNAINKQVTNLQNEIAGISSSEKIDQAQQQLTALKQSIAYIGDAGAPGVSQAHMDAVSKQLDQAQTTYTRLKQVEADQAQIRSLGIKFDSAAFEKQIADLNKELTDQVSAATQNTINRLNADGGTIDTMDELNQVKGTMMQELGKAVANIAISNVAQRKAILDQYNIEIAKGEEYYKNSKIIDKDQSELSGYVTDGNGEFKMSADNKPIPYMGDMQSAISDGVLFRRNNRGYSSAIPLATGGGSVSNSEKLAIMKSLSAGEITQEQANVMMGGGTPQFDQGYEGPSYNAVNETVLQKSVGDLLAGNQKYTSKLAQCGEGVNDRLISLLVTDQNLFLDPIDAKTAVTNSKQAAVGAVAVFDRTGTKTGDEQQKKYGFIAGHVGIVTKVDGYGTPTEIADRNRNGNKQYSVHPINSSQASTIKGYFDPAKAQGSTSEGPAGAKVYNGLNEADRGLVDLIANYDAPLPSTRTKNYSKIISAAAEVNPSFDAKKYPARQRFMNDRTAGARSQNIISVNTTVGHVNTLMDTIDGLGNTKIQALNVFKNRVANATGNSDITKFNVTADAVASEVAKVFKGGAASPTQEEIRDWKSIIKSSGSSDQLREGIAKQITKLLSSRMKAQIQDYKRNMDEYPDAQILYPEAIETLKRVGLDPVKFMGIESTSQTPVNAGSSAVGGNPFQSLRDSL